MPLSTTPNFPTSLDTLADPQSGDKMNASNIEHDLLHQLENAAIEALQAKVGVNSSAVTSSLDYKLTSTSSSNPGHKHTLASGATDVTASAAELNIMDGVTASTAEINLLDGVTSSTNELNILDGVTSTTAELNLVDGSVAGTSVASRALVLGASKNTDILVVDNGLKFNAPQGFLVNGKITTSVSSNNLTVAIKTLADADPSASDPVYVRIGNTVRSITAALSVTKNAGTNWFNSGSSLLATKEIDYFVYLGWDTSNSAVRIGFARAPYGRLYSDLSSTTTNSAYIAFDTAPGASDEIEVVGRFNAVLSATASFNWSIPATSIIVNRPIFETQWLSTTPQRAVSGGTVPTYTTTDNLQYRLSNNTASIIINWTNAAGGTAGAGTNAITFTLPFPLAQTVNDMFPGFNSYESGGTQALVMVQQVTDASTMRFLQASTAIITGNDQSSADRFIRGSCSYLIKT